MWEQLCIYDLVMSAPTEGAGCEVLQWGWLPVQEEPQRIEASHCIVDSKQARQWGARSAGTRASAECQERTAERVIWKRKAAHGCNRIRLPFAHVGMHNDSVCIFNTAK